jgi:RHS repeat-associated protein
MTAAAICASDEILLCSPVTDTYNYDAFGNQLNSTGSTPNNYLYRGEQYDQDLNLYYLRARYYNPATGRFLSRDPNEGKPVDPETLHKYLYADGDPVNGFDPRGLEDEVEYRKLGDPEAQYALGYMYHHGQAVAQDYHEALRWYQEAADHGYPKAQYDLGSMYYYGQGVPKDYDQAVRWYRNAADQGYARAQYALGSMYYNGVGLPQDYAEANQWLRKAAAQGNPEAERALGLSRSGSMTKMRWFEVFSAIIALPVGLWASFNSWMPGRKLQDRRWGAMTLLAARGASADS